MFDKKMKIFLIALLAGVIEDVILLYFFGVQITKNTLIGAIVFALLITLIIDKMILGDKKW